MSAEHALARKLAVGRKRGKGVCAQYGLSPFRSRDSGVTAQDLKETRHLYPTDGSTQQHAADMTRLSINVTLQQHGGKLGPHSSTHTSIEIDPRVDNMLLELLNAVGASFIASEVFTRGPAGSRSQVLVATGVLLFTNVALSRPLHFLVSFLSSSLAAALTAWHGFLHLLAAGVTAPLHWVAPGASAATLLTLWVAVWWCIYTVGRATRRRVTVFSHLKERRWRRTWIGAAVMAAVYAVLSLLLQARARASTNACGTGACVA
jgi:hypothetical protein